MNDAISPGPVNPSQAAGLPQLSVVVPTFNERDNVTTLFRRLETALTGTAFEVIFVDDNSPDGTWEVVRALARGDSRVRCIRRIGRRGLSGACIEGILASSAPCAAVIDADLQHDETQLPVMLTLLQSGAADLVVGSRYIEGGSADSFNKQRAGASALATEVAKRVLRVKIADPMSGFFMIRRDRFEQLAPQLSTQGFKILLDIVATARGDLRVKEIPYAFGARLHGESKLDSMVALDFLGLVLAKLTHDVVSLRFLLFAMVGSIGLFVHFAALFAALEARGIRHGFVTLHVGAGTFQPLRVDEIDAHVMHPETVSVPASTCEAIEAARAAGGRVIAVGTTVVRSLEAAATGGKLAPFEGQTRIFIKPGYRFAAVDAIVTNFHLPESTLLMLCSAFVGREPLLAAYRHAVAARYRFFSYGDAMFLTPAADSLRRP